MSLCACGCGGEVKVYRGKPRRFINLHQNRGKNNSNYGKHHSINTRDKIRYKALGRKLSSEHKLKIGKGAIGRIKSKNERDKLSLSHMGSKNPNYGKIFNKDGCGKGSYYNSPFQKIIWLRSSWEVAYAKYLDLKNIRWYYEWVTFDLENTTYTPDFFIPEENMFVEIKGYMRKKTGEKIDCFRKKYPEKNFKILFGNDLRLLGIKL